MKQLTHKKKFRQNYKFFYYVMFCYLFSSYKMIKKCDFVPFHFVNSQRIVFLSWPDSYVSLLRISYIN